MDKSDKIEFAKLIAEMGIAFGRDVDRETLAMYFNRLQHLTMYQVHRGINKIIDYDERYPVFSKIREVCELQPKAPRNKPLDVPQIEEVVLSNDLPATKDEFLAAMKDLLGEVEVK